MGRWIAYTYEVKAWEAGTRLVMVTFDAPFAMETTYEWSDVANGATHMALSNRGAPSGFGKVAAPVMRRAIQRANAKDLLQLKHILERA